MLVLFSPRDLMVTSTLVEVVWCCCCWCCRRRSRRRARASSLERSREKSSHRYHRFIGRRGHPWFRGPRSHASREGRPHFQFVLCRIILFIYFFTLGVSFQKIKETTPFVSLTVFTTNCVQSTPYSVQIMLFFCVFFVSKIFTRACS